MTNPDPEGKSNSKAVGTTFYPSAGPAVNEMPWLTKFSDVDHVFRSKDWEQGGGGLRDSHEFIGDGLLSLSGEDHYRRRRLESHLFRRQHMKRFENVAAEAIVERLAIAAIHRGSDDCARVELLHLLRSILYRISATLVGIDNVADESRFQTYQQCMDELIKAAHAEWLEEDHQVALDRALAFKRRFSDEFFQPSWRRREGQIRQQTEAASEAEPTLDLISLMIANRDAFEQWDPDVFLRETILFHDGAIHTIANAVPHTITELAAWMPKHAQHESAREDPAFLRLVCNETLRLHPPAPFLIRKAVRDTTLPSGLFFRGGDYVVLDMIVASRDTEAFGDNPNNFDPFRHRSPDVKPVGIAFGDGPHSCIGITLSIGQTNASDEGDIEGIMIRILRALYRAGIVPDPDEPAAKDPATARDEYAKFPVVFTNPLANS